MSLTVVKRPHDLGYPISDVLNSVTVTDSGGDALVTQAAHGLSTGDIVYLITDVSTYNGVWHITVIDPNTYEIHEYATAPPVGFIVNATGTSQVVIDSGEAILPVHLPMVYKIQSNLWPINGADTARTVSGFSNYNGYTALNISGDIKATGTASALEEVTVTGTTAIDGVYKILNWFSDTSFVIDLPYAASNSFSGGTVQYYYFNYHARVKIFAGIASGSFATLKTFEEVAEIRCLPDSTGLITVNINEFIKKKIDILSNNLLSPTLPFNLESSCDFNISVAESYDDSNGYTVEEFISSYTGDSAGIAINAKPPFKTRAVSLSPYLVILPRLQNFMTLFSAPVLTPGKYFDISFTARSGTRTLKREIYVNEVKVDEIDEPITITGKGIYRYSFDQSGWGEGRVDLSVYSGSTLISEVKTITVDRGCYTNSIYLTWLNYLGGFDYWDFTARKTHSVSVEESKTQEKNIFTNWPNSYGEFADTIRQQTSRSSRNSIRVESQHLTQAQVDAIAWIVSSPLVQIVNSVYDRRTVIVDGSSLRKYMDQDKTFTVSFTISYTDELPSQSL